eukprot:955071_1
MHGGKMSQWHCLQCTFSNAPSTSQCAMCHNNRMFQWQCITCTFLNASNISHCIMCDNPKQSMIKDDKSKWRCLFCTWLNEANTTTCNQCKKANTVIVNINHICLCGRKVVKYRYAWNECHSCCKRREKKEKGYYDC